jgi:hypothetical protein
MRKTWVAEAARSENLDDVPKGFSVGQWSPECPLWVISGHVQRKRSCPFYPPKADMCAATRDVRFVPIADIRSISTYHTDRKAKVFYKPTPG